jgi:acetylglutamate synthase
MNLTSKEISMIPHLKRVRKNQYRRNLDPEKIIERIKASFQRIHAVM